MKKKVVVADSGISAPQMQDFWRKVGDGTIDGEIFQEFLADPRRFSKGKGVTLARAISILGESKVITEGQAARTWEMKPPKDASIRYSEATLRQCAEENSQGKADWRLIYCHGLSLREQREKRGTSQNSQPCFYKDSTWWLEASEDNWATHKPQSSYHLINFRGQFGNLNWNQQEAEISKLGKEFERCHEAVFSEAILTIYMVNEERIAEDWWHWGISLDSNGSRVDVGNFDGGGLIVGGNWVDSSGQGLRVVLARKFEN